MSAAGRSSGRVPGRSRYRCGWRGRVPGDAGPGPQSPSWHRLQGGTPYALPTPDRSLVGAVYWYSIIHTPPEHLDGVCAEAVRVLAPGGHLLAAFQAGNGERVHRAELRGTKVSLTSYRHPPDEVVRVSERGRVAGARPNHSEPRVRPRAHSAGLHARSWRGRRSVAHPNPRTRGLASADAASTGGTGRASTAPPRPLWPTKGRGDPAVAGVERAHSG